MGPQDGRLPVSEKPGGVHAQKAGVHHQEGGKPHHVLARGAVHLMGPFQGQNRINKEIFKPKYHAVSFYVARNGLYKYNIYNSVFRIYIYCIYMYIRKTEVCFSWSAKAKR